MAQKRIILLLDGTWDDQDSGPTDTNIVRMQEIINRSLNPGPALPERPTAAGGLPVEKFAAGRTFESEKVEHKVFYERGVGTGAFDSIRGGALGEGLSGNIRRAYKFLSFYYEEGDQIFIFGFSRGAYTARSLVGYISAAGLLKRDDCTPEWEGKAWSYYRTAPNDRLPGLWVQLQPHVHDLAKFHIDCVGVFDTVGALGIPLTRFQRLNRAHYEFHNVELCTITKVNLHAIAIDERRSLYAATIWRKPKFKSFRTITEQVWFPGAHSDIGGGYVPEERRQSDYQHSLDDVTLDWMLKRLKALFRKFPIKTTVWPSLDPSWATAPQHEPRRGVYRLWPSGLRAMANSKISSSGWHQQVVCRDRLATVVNEMVHISALERLGTNVLIDRSLSCYAPRNLVTVLDKIVATYSGNAPAASTEIKVVKWDGTLFDPEAAADQSEIRAIVTSAQKRL